MKIYNKPLFDVIIITTEDVLEGSGVTVSETNAGFSLVDERL